MRTLLLSLMVLTAAGLQRVAADDKAQESAASADAKRLRWASPAAGQKSIYRVWRMKDNPTIDADWNKAAWKDVMPVTLEYYMGKEPAHQPKAQAKVAYDDRHIYLIWKIEDRYVLARRTQHKQDVWRDSCAEFFFTPGGDPLERGYFNLETNCGGVKLLEAHIPGKKRENFTPEDFASIVTANSLKAPIDPEIEKPTTWTLEYKIPFSLLERVIKIERPAPGVTWRANFYKCADQSSYPHWITWAPVTNPKPSFHLPKYFGTIEFE